MESFAGLKKSTTFAPQSREKATIKTKKLNGALVQLVRIHACHAWGHGFESRTHRLKKSSKNFLGDFFYITLLTLVFICFSYICHIRLIPLKPEKYLINMCISEKQMDEHDLILRLIDGDENAFCELYATYKSRLIYFAMRFLKSREYAEDIFQDTFVIIWQGRQFIDPNTSFSAYLYTIVRNRVLNQLRDLQNQENLKNQILSQSVDYTNDTTNKILEDDLSNLIGHAMQQLTGRQREIFTMSREKQMSHREIADVLGISVNTVQEHISVSLRILRHYLERRNVKCVDVILLLVCLDFLQL